MVNDMFVYMPRTYSGHYSIPNKISKIIGGAFMFCSGLTSITIPNSITNIGDDAFFSCSGLTSITIPNSVTNIGQNAFWGCNNIISVSIPNSVIFIGNFAFSECGKIEKLYYDCDINANIPSKSLKELHIGDNLTIVYDYFESYRLTKILLGKNVAQIRAQAFKNSQLEEFTITGEGDINCYPNIFGTQDLSKATLYVPEGKTEYYQTTEPWSKFGKVLTLNGDTPDEPEKCATPVISYSNGELIFSCETEGAKCTYNIKSPDVTYGGTFSQNMKLPLYAYYNIYCEATAEGYTKSDLAEATLYWLPTEGTLETNINTAETRGVMASSANGFVTLSGLNTDEQVSFYTADGRELGTVKAIDGTAHFAAQSGTVVIAKIGKESLKISIK